MFFNSPVQKGGKEAEKQEKRNHTLDPLPLLREMKEHSLVVSFLFLVVVVVVVFLFCFVLFCFVLCFFFLTKATCLVTYPVSYSGSRALTVASFLALTLTF